MLLCRHLFACLFLGTSVVFPLITHAQQPSAQKDALLWSLDSISFSSSPAKDFGFIYLKTTIAAKNYYKKDSDTVQALMNRFEDRFAWYFLTAAIAHRDSSDIPLPWKQYYANPQTSVLRHILYGINAHINNDLSEALIHEFTQAEIKALKKSYYAFHHYLHKDYEDIYEYAFSVDKNIRRLHFFTFGAGRWYGELLLKKWRKRQLKIAELYYSKPERFQKKKKRIERKSEAVGRLIEVYF